MVWKSNLDENEQEFIEDFGAKTGDAPTMPTAAPRKPSARKPAVASRLTTAKKDSPQKGQQPAVHEMTAYAAETEEGQGGSGEELAQTLEKVVS